MFAFCVCGSSIWAMSSILLSAFTPTNYAGREKLIFSIHLFVEKREKITNFFDLFLRAYALLSFEQLEDLTLLAETGADQLSTEAAAAIKRGGDAV